MDNPQMGGSDQRGRRTYCGCTPDAASRVSNRAMAPCDNAVETCANHVLIKLPTVFLLATIQEKEAPSSSWGASEDGA
jgi:hypothetical protein